MTSTPTTGAARRAPARIGRPPRIDRGTIARAVIELGFDDVTMKTAAAHIGVSVPGLYHYVKGRDELVRLAAEYRLAEVALPQLHGQVWQTWLREWGRYTRLSMSIHPELLQHFLDGGIDDDRHLEVVDRVLHGLVGNGFTAVDALRAWETIAALAIGTAVGDIRERAADASGRTWMARVHGELARRPAPDLSALRAVTADGWSPDRDREFELQMDLVIAGIESTRPQSARR